jgi:uncharacterized protein YybS (DUF2232 family)
MIKFNSISILGLLRRINIITKIANPNRRRPPRIEPMIIATFFPEEIHQLNFSFEINNQKLTPVVSFLFDRVLTDIFVLILGSSGFVPEEKVCPDVGSERIISIIITQY